MMASFEEFLSRMSFCHSPVTTPALSFLILRKGNSFDCAELTLFTMLTQYQVSMVTPVRAQPPTPVPDFRRQQRAPIGSVGESGQGVGSGLAAPTSCFSASPLGQRKIESIVSSDWSSANAPL